MIIPIGSDHAAFEAKEKVKTLLGEIGYEIKDFGCDSCERADYPLYASKVAEAISSGKYQKGILLCGTGIGMSIAANKYPHVRAALCHDTFTAVASREHNDANILVMGARVLSAEEIAEIVRIWLKTEFTGGRHSQRLSLIDGIEKRNMSHVYHQFSIYGFSYIGQGCKIYDPGISGSSGDN